MQQNIWLKELPLDKLDPIEIDPKTFLRDHCTLPALPKLVSQVQEILRSDNVNITEAAKLISGDPSLVAQILKVVNSAYYALPTEVADVKFAIAYLGINEVYPMVLSMSAVKTLDIKAEKELSEFWSHSFFSALCSKYLAKKYRPMLSTEDLWSAAILHDIGKLVYLKFFPDHYKALKTYCKNQGCLFSEAETHFSFPSSAYLGTLLCDHWHLPHRIKESCRLHSLRDLPSISNDAPAEQLNRMVCLANLIAVLANDEINTAKKEDLRDAIMASLDCTEQNFLVIMGDIYELRLEVERFV